MRTLTFPGPVPTGPGYNVSLVPPFRRPWLAPSMCMLFPSATYLCFCFIKVIQSNRVGTNKHMIFYYRHISAFVSFQASVCSL